MHELLHEMDAEQCRVQRIYARAQAGEMSMEMVRRRTARAAAAISAQKSARSRIIVV